MNENIAAACFKENDESVNCEINNDNKIEEKLNKTKEYIKVRTNENFEEIIKKDANNDVQENILAYLAAFLTRAYLSKKSYEEC